MGGTAKFTEGEGTVYDSYVRMADSRAQAWSNMVFKSSVLFSNNLWLIKGDCKLVIKSSLILSSRYCAAVTLWKLQSLLRVFRAERYSSSVS